MEPIISCGDAVKQLWEYIDGEIHPDRKDEVDRHLAFCRRCCGEVEFIEELHKFIATKAAENIPADVHARLLQTLNSLEKT